MASKKGTDSASIQGLTPEEQQIFERFYQGRVDEAAAGGSDKDELRVARDVLGAAITDGLTPTSDGGTSYVRRKGTDWSDQDVMKAARNEIEGGRSSGAGGSKEMLQGIAILILALFGGVYWFFFSGPEEVDKAGPATVVLAITAEATEEAIDDGEGAATPIPTLEADMFADIVDSGVKTGLVTPRTLEIKGVSFVVQAVQVSSGDWQLPLEERAVNWIYGTVINYVIGIEATEDNKNLLASLKPGDELLVRMSTGDVYRFAYADAVRVAPQASEIFRQNRPGMTLVLLGDTEQETRVVIRANYLPESDYGFTEQLPEVQAALGERIALNGSIYVTCIEAQVLYGANAPPGYVWQAVQYRVENMGEVEVATDSFKNHIETEGVSYPIVAVPHELNPTPDIPPVLASGQVFSTTAIYAIPETALRQNMAWEFVPGPSGLRARVLLPAYTGLVGPVVQISAAALSDEGGLQVSVEVTAGLREVEVKPENFKLKDAQLDQQLENGNHFPWQINPGETGTFVLHLLPDEGVRIIQLIVLEHGFELEY